MCSTIYHDSKEVLLALSSQHEYVRHCIKFKSLSDAYNKGKDTS